MKPSRLSAFSSLSCHTASSLLQKLYTFVSLKDMNFFFFSNFLIGSYISGDIKLTLSIHGFLNPNLNANAVGN